MEIRSIALRNWTMYTVEDMLVLTGVADEHPKLGLNIEVTTSAVMSIEEDKNFIMSCRTRNSVYMLDWRYANLNPTESLAAPQTINCHETVREKYILYLQLVRARDKDINELNVTLRQHMSLIAEGRKQLDELRKRQDSELIGNASKYSNCIFMNVSNISKGNNVAYNINGKTGIIKPSCNSGDLLSAISYKTSEKDGIDVSLEYLVGHHCMDISAISTNVESIVIHNNKKATILINGNYEVPFDHIVVIESRKLRG